MIRFAVRPVLAVFLVLASASFHHSVLRWPSGGMARIAIRPGPHILCIVFIVLLAHVGEIVLYAVSVQGLGLGVFGGLAVEQPRDLLHFSIVTYTSLGLGDAFPSSHLRFLAGVETLNGLLLIAWSGSFIYLAMGRLWPWERSGDPARWSGQRGLSHEHRSLPSLSGTREAKTHGGA